MPGAPGGLAKGSSHEALTTKGTKGTCSTLTKPSLDTLDVSRSRSVLELFFVGFQSLDAILDGSRAIWP